MNYCLAYVNSLYCLCSSVSTMVMIIMNIYKWYINQKIVCFFLNLTSTKCFSNLRKKMLLQILTWHPSFALLTNERFFRFGISLAHEPVHATDFSVVNVHVDELSSARIWQHKLCATLSANVNINYRLLIKVYYRICTLRHIRIEIIHGSQYVFGVLTWVGGY